MKNPIVLRKKYESEIKNRDSKISSLNWKIQELEEKLVLANRVADEILPRLVRLNTPVHDKEFNTYRICADFHRDMVERCFTHGGDAHMIRYFAENLSRQIEQKMIQFNFARCDRI